MNVVSAFAFPSQVTPVNGILMVNSTRQPLLQSEDSHLKIKFWRGLKNRTLEILWGGIYIKWCS